MRYAIALPQFVRSGRFDPGPVREFLARVEGDGRFDGVWAQEQVLGRMPNLGSIEALTFAAACTSRVRLGCAVFVSTLHSPVHLAKSLATLDQISGGRLDVGLGTGGKRMFGAFGVDPASYVARFTEGLAVMRALWTQETVTFDGRFWQLAGAAMEPKPVQRPGPPIWFGGSHPNALRRAVRLADGFFGAGSTTTERFAEQVTVLREVLREQGKDPAEYPVAKRVYLAVDPDGDRARRRIAAALDELYGFFGVSDGRLAPVAVAGTAEEVAEGLRVVIEAGAGRILLNPLFDDADQLERLTAEVLPRLDDGAPGAGLTSR